MEEPFKSPLEPVVELFLRHGVEYIVIGGMAEVLHGGLSATFDVDVCYSRSPENLSRLARALAELHPRLRGAPADLPFRLDAKTLEMGSNFAFDTDVGPLDLLGWVEPLGDYAPWNRTRWTSPSGTERCTYFPSMR